LIVAASRAAGRAPLRLALAAMGTRFELALHGNDRVQARAAGEEAVAEIDACHRRFNRFAESSLVSLIRRSPTGRTIPLDTDTFELLADAVAVHHASGGAFDITVAPLVDSLVYANRQDEQAGIAPGMEAIELDPDARTIRITRAGVSLDLGAIAKGHALDLAARVLRENGIDAALLHGGTSSVIAIGRPPGADAWRIGIARAPGTEPVTLCDAALSVSTARGDTTGDASLAGHVVDPRAGTLAARPRAVVVSGPTARLADAWATALVVLGTRPAALGRKWNTHFFDMDPV